MKNYQDGGEAIVEAFRNLGIDYIMSSPGSEWSPVWEAMSRQTLAKNKGPTFIDCWHETLAVDMAMGYTAVTGKPQAVLIHAGVGLMHGSMAMLTASQGEIPMLVMSGESTTFGDDPQQDMEPQWYGGVSVGGADKFVAPIVKWSSQVTHSVNLYQSVVRAGEMAQRVPQGPVYLSLSLEAMFAEWLKPDELRHIPAAPKLQPLPQDVATIAALVRKAKLPVIVTEGPGRDPESFHALIALAEAIGAPVIGARGNPYTAFPKSHPMWLGYGDFEPLKTADLILLVGGKAPWYPPSKRPGPGQIVVIGENPLKATLAYQNLQADHYLEGDNATALKAQFGALAGDAGDKAVIAARRERWTQVHDALVASLAGSMDKARAAATLDAVGLAAIAGDMLPKDTIYIDETITHMPVMRPYLPLEEPQSFFRLGNGALGQGIGNALGVKLARKDQPVVLFIGDGTFLYNPIIQALGASKNYELPLMIVVCNNAKYEAMRKGHERFYPNGAAEAMKWKYGVEIPGFAYENLGSHFDFVGARAESPAELRAAFEQGLAALKEGRTAILNVSLTK